MDYDDYLIDIWNTEWVPFFYSSRWIWYANWALDLSLTSTAAESMFSFSTDTLFRNNVEAVNTKWNEYRNGFDTNWVQPVIDFFNKVPVISIIGSFMRQGMDFVYYALNTFVEMSSGQLDSFGANS